MKNNLRKNTPRAAAYILFPALILLICISLSLTAAADGNSIPYVVDETGILSASETDALETRAKSFTEKYNINCVIIMVDSLDGKRPVDYADDYYDNNFFGVGNRDGGILLLIAIQSRDWYISTCGSAISSFTDRELDRIGSETTAYLSSNNYYGALNEFISASERTLLSSDAESAVILGITSSEWLLILVISLLAAAVTLLVMRGVMNNVRGKSEAADYAIKESFRLTRSFDMFLYRTVSRTVRQSSSGGGSSTHRSSSGISHGGRGGKF